MKIEYDGKVMELDRPILVYKLLEKLSLNRETYLVVVNDRLVTEDHRLLPGDHVRLIRVVSGG
ncbi:MAG: MoaD/ThiS family protein [Syntrophorhabdaceae bacterium]|nr:MoaD/ThiS family protein [Syntrophorhabdaceae bacterium]